MNSLLAHLVGHDIDSVGGICYEQDVLYPEKPLKGNGQGASTEIENESLDPRQPFLK